MKNFFKILIVVIVSFMLGGCYTTGLSLRERGGYNYSNMVYGLYDATTDFNAKATTPQPPIKLAVAQIGEGSPSKIVVEKLKNHPELFSEVIELPAGGESYNTYYNRARDEKKVNIEKKVKKMVRLARDLGADYMFLYGGSLDYGTGSNWVGIFDITIIGGFVLPSKEFSVEGKATGAMVDIKSSKVLFLTSASKTKKSYAATYTIDKTQKDSIVAIRNELVDSLTDEFIEKLKMRI